MKLLQILLLLISCVALQGQTYYIGTVDTIRYTEPPQTWKIGGVVYEERETGFPASTFRFASDSLSYYYAERAATYLDLPTYDSLGVTELADSSALHPDIVDCGKLWNGYRYWMTYTPLPEVRPDANENPHIVASNDLKTWIEPVGIDNPIAFEPPISYNSDPDLLFDNNKLYCIYRSWTNLPGPGNRALIVAKHSSNGINWSDSVELIQPSNLSRITSPSVIKDGNYYYLYAINAITPNTAFIERWRSSSMLSGWSAYDTCTVDFTDCFLPDKGAAETVNFRIWHFNVNKIGLNYVMPIYTRIDANQNLYAAQNIWLASSSNGKTFTAGKYPLILRDVDSQVNSATGNNWWDLGLYRAAILPAGDSLNLFYSGWAGEYEDYPNFIGRTTIKKYDPEIIFSKPYNTVSTARASQLVTANSLTGGYTFADNINRANSEVINPSSCGKNYTIRLGKFDIRDNYLIKDTTINSLLELNPDSVNYECTMNLVFNENYVTTDAQAWRIYMKATAYNGYTVDISGGTSNTLILRAVSSATTILDRKHSNYIDSTDINVLKFKVVGNNFKVWVNGIKYFDHTLTVAEFGNNQTNYNNVIASKRICLFQPTTYKNLRIKNITIRNLNSQGL